MPDRPDSVADERYPARCRTCGKQRAFPVRVRTAGENRVELDIQCLECGDEWAVFRTTQPLFVRRPYTS